MNRNRQIAATVFGTLVLATSLVVTSACTDDRTQPAPPIREKIQTEIRSSMQFVGDVTFGNKAMNVMSIQASFGSFYVTGSDFGFAKFDVSSDPTRPQLIFAARNNLQAFVGDGTFNLDNDASGAVGVWENPSSDSRFALLSGRAGTVAVNMSTNTPRIVLRRPPPTAKGEPNQDYAYVYRGIIAHPAKPVFLGWTPDTYLYTLSGSDLSLQSRSSYGNGTVCCVRNVVAWNGYMVAAFGPNLVLVPFCGDDDDSGADETPCRSGAAFGRATVFRSLQAQYVAATQRYLYVYHEPSDGYPEGLKYRRGIYIFDAQTGDNVDVVALPAGVRPRLMAVTPQDTHVYFNNDGQKLDIYRLLRASK